MVITPNEARRITEDEEQDVRSIERKIDEYITKCCKHGIDACYDIEGIPSRVLKEIKKKYEEAGWDVKITYDQRDGNYIRFK